jgi:hypothetical protein
VRVAQRWRNDAIGQLLPEYFFAPEAERLFGCRIELDDSSVVIDAIDAIHRRVEDAPYTRLAFAQRGFGPLAFADVDDAAAHQPPRCIGQPH